MQFPNIFVYSIVNFHILTALSHNGTRTGEETLCSLISKCNESLLFFKSYFIYFPFEKTYLLVKSRSRAMIQKIFRYLWGIFAHVSGAVS